MNRPQMIFLAVSLVALAGAGQAFAWANLVAPKRAAAADLRAMTETLQMERAAIDAGEELPVAGLELMDLSLPQLLSQVQEIALNVNVIVDSVAPVELGSDRLRVSMQGLYPDLVRFLARFETLPVEVVELQMGAEDQSGPVVPLSVVFVQTDRAPVRSFTDAAAFEAALKADAPRNPFVAWNGEVRWTPEADSADLTWVLRLSGVSQIGDQRIATIDDRDYRVGDRIGGRTIREIGEDSVILADVRGEEERLYTLGFRYALAGAGN